LYDQQVGGVVMIDRLIIIVQSPHRIRAAAVDFPLITKRVREHTPLEGCIR
jgi:hypothetical protein